jgi:NAD(P) transhydrogenase subunit alpha
MIVGILSEPQGEARVSLLPEAVAQLHKKQIQVWVEAGAGSRSSAPDSEYEKAGAMLASRAEVVQKAEVILSISQPTPNEMAGLTGKILIGVYQPLFHITLMQQWAVQGVTTFSLDMLPRTTRAQSMDVLSSQANISGYKAVLLAANLYPRYFPMFMTAAGSIAPAKVVATRWNKVKNTNKSSSKKLKRV